LTIGPITKYEGQIRYNFTHEKIGGHVMYASQETQKRPTKSKMNT